MSRSSEVEFQAELKLSWIKGGSRTTEIFSATVALPESINVREERRCGAFVEAIEKIEAFGDHVEPQTFAQTNVARDTQIKRRETVSDATIAPQSAILERRWQHKRAVCRDARAIRLR